MSFARPSAPTLRWCAPGSSERLRATTSRIQAKSGEAELNRSEASNTTDFTWMHDVVERSLSDEPGGHHKKVGAEGRAKDTKQSCAYHPVS